jgi:hypothetical protein
MPVIQALAPAAPVGGDWALLTADSGWQIDLRMEDGRISKDFEIE